MDIKPGQKWVMHGMHENEITIVSVEDQEIKYRHPSQDLRADEDQQCSIEELADWGVLSYEPLTIYDELELMLDD
jgi:hypothetical protein|tara:strand:- start:918 stop:1142 length:225 start_codon:yes stop_codon:yes gene_type:complete